MKVLVAKELQNVALNFSEENKIETESVDTKFKKNILVFMFCLCQLIAGMCPEFSRIRATENYSLIV
jgi:hypothetical protein